jgi:beta-catenin-like protein 1
VVCTITRVELPCVAQLKRAVTSLTRKMTANQELRIKNADEPARFMDSEVELFGEITNMQALATSPELYVEFVKLNGVTKMTELLDHENKDIALAAVELANELTDPEALVEAESEDGARALVDALVEKSFLELLIKNLQRLDEAEDDQRQGVYNTLAIVENLSEVQPAALDSMCEKSDLVAWLLQRLTVKAFDQNKLYASEILSILCQSSDANKARIGGGGGIDKLLGLVAPWKKKEPKDSDESELISNLFNTICSALMVAGNQTTFVEGEGVELMVIMLQARKFAARCALKVLDYAMMRQTSACEHFVRAMGLKTLFPAFMKPSTVWITKSPDGKLGQREDEEHVVSIVASLLLRLSGEAHARCVGKFVEQGFEKLDRLVELHEKYHRQVAPPPPASAFAL